MRGRKPIPTKLHELRGNPSRLNLDARANEPQPPADMPSPPEYLDAEARAEWGRVAPGLHACGVLTAVDRAALAAYCQAWSRVVKLEGIVQKTGEVMPEIDPETKRPTGRFFPSPYMAALNKTLRTMHQFASEFGMTPSSRTRLQVTPPVADDPLEALLRGEVPAN
jgi:P27 family predicted phage terminase small subunit